MSDSLAAALARLPHGPEFRFIDNLLTLAPGKSGTAVYKVRGDEPFLRGHFPSEPILPGVILIEAAAQLAGVVAQSDTEKFPLRELKLTAVQNIKISGTARPGETLQLRATTRARMAGLIQSDVECYVGDTKILSGSVTLAGHE